MSGTDDGPPPWHSPLVDGQVDVDEVIQVQGRVYRSIPVPGDSKRFHGASEGSEERAAASSQRLGSKACVAGHGVSEMRPASTRSWMSVSQHSSDASAQRQVGGANPPSEQPSSFSSQSMGSLLHVDPKQSRYADQMHAGHRMPPVAAATSLVQSGGLHGYFPQSSMAAQGGNEASANAGKDVSITGADVADIFLADNQASSPDASPAVEMPSFRGLEPETISPAEPIIPSGTGMSTSDSAHGDLINLLSSSGGTPMVTTPVDSQRNTGSGSGSQRQDISVSASGKDSGSQEVGSTSDGTGSGSRSGSGDGSGSGSGSRDGNGGSGSGGSTANNRDATKQSGRRRRSGRRRNGSKRRRRRNGNGNGNSNGNGNGQGVSIVGSSSSINNNNGPEDGRGQQSMDRRENNLTTFVSPSPYQQPHANTVNGRHVKASASPDDHAATNTTFYDDGRENHGQASGKKNSRRGSRNGNERHHTERRSGNGPPGRARSRGNGSGSGSGSGSSSPPSLRPSPRQALLPPPVAPSASVASLPIGSASGAYRSVSMPQAAIASTDQYLPEAVQGAVMQGADAYPAWTRPPMLQEEPPSSRYFAPPPFTASFPPPPLPNAVAPAVAPALALQPYHPHVYGHVHPHHPPAPRIYHPGLAPASSHLFGPPPVMQQAPSYHHGHQHHPAAPLYGHHHHHQHQHHHPHGAPFPHHHAPVYPAPRATNFLTDATMPRYSPFRHPHDLAMMPEYASRSSAASSSARAAAAQSLEPPSTVVPADHSLPTHDTPVGCIVANRHPAEEFVVDRDFFFHLMLDPGPCLREMGTSMRVFVNPSIAYTGSLRRSVPRQTVLESDPRGLLMHAHLLHPTTMEPIQQCASCRNFFRRRNYFRNNRECEGQVLLVRCRTAMIAAPDSLITATFKVMCTSEHHGTDAFIIRVLFYWSDTRELVFYKDLSIRVREWRRQKQTHPVFVA